MKSHKNNLILLVGAFSCLLSFASPTATLEKTVGAVEFLAVANPGSMRIRGTTTDDKAFQGQLKLEAQKLVGSAKFKLDSLDTGIALRTRHMKEKYLETQKFPEAEFVMTNFTLPENLLKGDGTAENLDFEGTLTLHGTQKPVKGKAKAKREGKNLELTFDFSCQLEDYSITKPKFLAISIDKPIEVSVKVSGELAAATAKQDNT